MSDRLAQIVLGVVVLVVGAALWLLLREPRTRVELPGEGA